MILPIVLLAVLILLIAAAAVLMAELILRPPRMTDGKAVYLLQRLSPGDLGMQFESLNFEVRDERTNRPLKIAAWWIPHPAGGNQTVVLIHGYADAKVGAMAWAPTWRQLGYHIIAVDLRAHGESGGRHMTAGIFERSDLQQVLDQFRASHPQQTQQLVLFGISLGAIVSLATAALRDDIAAIVLESPVSSFRVGLREQSRLIAMPLPWLLPIAVKIAKAISGADFDAIDPLELIRQIKTPLMVIQGGDDVLVPADDGRAIEEAMKNRSSKTEYWRVDGVPHLFAMEKDPEEYRRRIEAFLAQTKIKEPQMNADEH